ncbi:MAG: radical SAM family heme chaperone HemW [Candidatus Gastranaerophilales bacterium]|nr:radical SAM family heme chaperone HemW [Candidatus Gastranaerophilales bacterium]
MTKHAYIHIPFCLRKCNYCSFVSGKNIQDKEQYLNALFQEIKSKYKKEKLKTLYIGGGTPSLLEPNEIENIISLFNFEEKPEITIEINPETITKEKVNGFRVAGVNRASLGVQTFNDNILKIIGRKHSEKDVFNAIEDIKNTGINNISIDLIYGLPTQTIEIFNQDIEKALSLDIQHISSYGLKIEEGSFFYNNQLQNLPDDEKQAEMFLHLCSKLKQNHFEHYEISNFSKVGYTSQHNTAYWKNKNYYGFGLNASGYENNIRYKNTLKIKDYINNPLKKEEENKLSIQEIMEEEIFLALRLKEGLNITDFNEKFKMNFEQKYQKIIEKYSSLGLLKVENSHCRLTENGFLLSNDIMSEFID